MQALLSELMSGKLSDENFSKHLHRTYDSELLAQLFVQVKRLADEAYRLKQFGEAVQYYTGCILLVTNSTERSKLYSNRSLSFYQSAHFEHAYADSLKCLALTPNWPKAWFRAAKALSALDRPEISLSCMDRCKKLIQEGECDASANAELQQVIKEITDLHNLLHMHKRRQRYQTEYSRFEALAKDLEEEQKREALSQAQSTSNIEFNENLSAEQRALLTKQLTGRSGETSESRQLGPKRIAHVHSIELDWRKRAQCARSDDTAKATQVLLECAKLSAFASSISQLVSSCDNGLNRIMYDAFVSSVCGARTAWPTTLLLGASNPMIFGEVLARSRNIVVVSDNPIHVELCVSSARAYNMNKTDEGAAMCHFLTTSQFRDSFDQSTNEFEDALNGLREESSTQSKLRKDGMRVILSASQWDHRKLLRAVSVLVLDQSMISPYLLGPPSLPHELSIVVESSPSLVVFPSKIDLRVGLANISRTPNLGMNDGYSDQFSLMPMSLSTQASDCVLFMSDVRLVWSWTKAQIQPSPASEVIELTDVSAPRAFETRDALNAVVFSLVLYGDQAVVEHQLDEEDDDAHRGERKLTVDGMSCPRPFLDTWQFYRTTAERKLDVDCLAPSFLWLSAVGPIASRSATPRSPHSPFGRFSSQILATSVQTTLKTMKRIVSQDDRSSASSSISSAEDAVHTSWLAQVKADAQTSLQSTHPRAGSPQDSATAKLASISVFLHREDAAALLSAVDVEVDGVLFSSSEHVVARECLTGSKWYQADSLGLLRPPRRIRNDGSPSTVGGLRSFSIDHQSVNQAWLSDLKVVRNARYEVVTSRERKLRAHLMSSPLKDSAKRGVTMRLGVTGLTQPLLALEVIAQNVKRARTDVGVAIAPNSIEVGVGVDVFSSFSSCHRVLRQQLRMLPELRYIKVTSGLTFKKLKIGPEWNVGNTITTLGGGSKEGEGESASQDSPEISDRSEEELIEHMRKFLDTDGYVTVQQADITQLRVAMSNSLSDAAREQQQADLLQALSILYRAPPTTPGIDDYSQCVMLKQRFDVLIYESPESLAERVDWLKDSYIRQLLFAKLALCENGCVFYPGRMVTYAFLARFSPEREVDEQEAMLRSLTESFNFDAITELTQVTEATLVKSIDLNEAKVHVRLEPTVLKFKLLPGQSQIFSRRESCVLENISLVDECASAGQGLVADMVRPYDCVVTWSEYHLADGSVILSHRPASVSRRESAGVERRFPRALQRYHRLPRATSAMVEDSCLSLLWAMDDQGSDYSFHSIPRSSTPTPNPLENLANDLLRRSSETSMKLSELMTVSKEGSRSLQDGALAISMNPRLTSTEFANNLLYSSLI